MKTKEYINNKGQISGYYEYNFLDGSPSYRCMLKNNNRCGYAEFHFSNHTTFYIR
jgi:hypothetical protein